MASKGDGKYKVVWHPLDWFKENPDNYRRHPEEQIEVLRRSLRRFGVFRNAVARPDGTLLAGHGIIKAARLEGLTEYPAYEFEGTAAEARALLVADNEQSRLAEDDGAQLAALLRDLGEGDEELLGLTGHDEGSIEALLAGSEFDPQIVPMPELPSGDRAPFQQMTFTLSDLQVQDVKAAVDAAKDAGPFAETGNENSNGNALARICEEYLSWAERRTS